MTVTAPQARLVGRSESSDASVQPPAASSRQERLRFFFEPLQLHLELANLPVEFGFNLIPRFLVLGPTIREHLRQNIQKMPAPLADLVGVNLELRCDLGDRFFAFDHFQSDFGLEDRFVLFPHKSHFTILPHEDMAGLKCT